MNIEIKNENGTINISSDAIATVAGVAATECYGIVGMAVKNVKDGIVHLLKRESYKKGVSVTSQDEGLNIDLHIIVLYGTNITAIADSVISTVKYAVEEHTGLSVNNVGIFVEGVKVDSE